MRDSNYSFPAQNRVCVSITAQLYDRRALDTASMLPLLHSLTHLTYLTSTSPRIRDILVIDGGLERLLEILQESALPRSATSPIADWYSLRGPHTAAVINHQQQISLRHSLAFQCVVNIGVRGSEMVRTRVVQSGALDVVAQIMEVWLQGKGMSIHSGPLGSQIAVDRAAAGLQHPWYQSSRSRDRHRERERERERYRETRHTSGAEASRSRNSPPLFPEHRSHTRQPMGSSPHGLPPGRVITKESLERSMVPQDEPSPTDIIVNMLTLEQRASITRINAVARLTGIDRGNLDGGLVPSGFIFVEERPSSRLPPREMPVRPTRVPVPEIRPEEQLRAMSMTPESVAEGEDDVSMDSSGEQTEPAPVVPMVLSRSGTITSPERRDVPPPRQGEQPIVIEQPTPRAAVPTLPAMGINIRPRSIRTPSHETSMRALQEEAGGSPFASGSNSTLSSLNDQAGPFAGPSLTPSESRTREPVEALNGLVEVDVEARTQAEVDLAMGAPPGAPGATQTPRIAEMTPRQTHRNNTLPATTIAGTDMTGMEDRHETTAFAAVIAAGAPRGFSDLSDLVNVIETTTPTGEVTYNDDTILLCLQLLAYLSKYPHVRAAFHHPRRPMHPDCDIPDGIDLPERPALSRSNNMFSLVERFTFRPSGPDPEMQKLPADIQYWAGVIMRNACRKDDAHGGIRQCANVNCGKWEKITREFAKCRRCRKAKYCSKECQSKAWQEGHRFW
ncbi:hypothetical protein FFLO_05151 [Filobasidium floriforme]|uniref:MYND-type domain-containing protein n=1 Tax=Filobasidium floriforme TaxID=5210 RepID=A0A8K0JHF4_9TREE|nr:hypothetical protein FFLO_05151 [Filobasidium floriforme]